MSKMRKVFTKILSAKKPLNLIYNEEDLNIEYYKKVKNFNDRELEYQIGRLTNFKRILGEISQEEIPGDIIEFGTWHGFSLLWIAYLSERFAIFDKKIIGIDGFAGLPESEGPFKKYQFSDATLSTTRRNLLGTKYLYDITKNNIIIKKALFSDVERMNAIIDDRKFCFIHIDCDITVSLVDILKVIDGKLADICYILIDDYKFDTNLGNCIEEYIKKLTDNGWSAVVHSETRLTKNFLLKNEFNK